jgi:hypothetical protein
LAAKCSIPSAMGKIGDTSLWRCLLWPRRRDLPTKAQSWSGYNVLAPCNIHVPVPDTSSSARLASTPSLFQTNLPIPGLERENSGLTFYASQSFDDDSGSLCDGGWRCASCTGDACVTVESAYGMTWFQDDVES